MPDFGGGHAMNPAVAKRKAAGKPKDADDTEENGEGAGDPGGKPKQAGDLKRITIEPAQNGHVVTNEYARKPKSSKAEDRVSEYDTVSSKHAYADKGGVQSHIDEHLGD